MEKAYKLLAQQEDISNKKAKELIDRGLVYVTDKKVKIARAEMPNDTNFRVERIENVKIIYQDEHILAINKPALLDSYELQDAIEEDETVLIHRLDRDTSGVLILARNEDFLADAIEAFKRRKVKKRYVAWVEGVFCEEITINAPIATHKQGGKAFSEINEERGRPAITVVKPLEIQGKKSKVEIEIMTGRTHQIRVHLSSIGHPIVGDERYGSVTRSKRILLHAKALSLLGYAFEAKEPRDIQKYK
ncbi:RluA family pseudouridine synthase [Sulfurovum sp. bin170]|uniref:RluA family pseudouridine synthase n=1 Tax=Sulfurovum sp. bin170 TaxID=2695268 RepID=UPI0013DEA61B|nr:RluA family pseudouridine synthase [Sulfurovum sp. bin170]NEW61015.1 RluA family pseudouridine synthase [Sulfurovum sp. bin170]